MLTTKSHRCQSTCRNTGIFTYQQKNCRLGSTVQKWEHWTCLTGGMCSFERINQIHMVFPFICPYSPNILLEANRSIALPVTLTFYEISHFCTDERNSVFIAGLSSSSSSLSLRPIEVENLSEFTFIHSNMWAALHGSGKRKRVAQVR